MKGYYFETHSLINGAPIVVVLTLESKNVKTGDMIQIWILDARANPLAVSKARKDSSICGSCPRRHSLGGDCYVRLEKAPLSVWRAWKRSKKSEGFDQSKFTSPAPYRPLNLTDEDQIEAMLGRAIRFGAYGDPAAVAVEFWDAIVDAIEPRGWTGYTHQWRESFASEHKRYCMASVDSEREQVYARLAGWRTFRVRSEDEALLGGEIVCPASDEGGHRLTCIECLACHGAMTNATQASVAIIEHGARAKTSARKAFSV